MMSLAFNGLLTAVLTCGLLLTLGAVQTAMAQSHDLGDGFRDHGVFSTAAISRGTVCTVDGDGNDVVLVWLFDHRYAYALAVIDARTGEIEEIPRPISSDCPFGSILASNGRYYTYFGGHFMEFDPTKRQFTFVQEGPSRIAFGMTEDDQGVIWASICPDADVVSFDPATGQFRHYGAVYEHPSIQYPRSIAADDQGWIYVGVDLSAGRIIILNRDTGQTTAVGQDTGDAGASFGHVLVQRDMNGRVYGHVGDDWYELYGGEATRLDGQPRINRKPIITGGQNLFHRDLPSGERVRQLDLLEGRLVVENPETGEIRELELQIDGQGGVSMGLVAAPDGTLVGGTYIPLRFFGYNPQTDHWDRRACFGQWNALTTVGDMVYVAAYSGGTLLEWDVSGEWVPTERDNPDSNPRIVVDRASREAGRPYTILAHPDGRHIIYGGTPGFGYTGGGLVIYDRETESSTVISHEEMVPWHSQASLVALPDGSIVGGTSTEPALGGVRRADVAELYIFDMETRRVQWHGALIEGAERYNDMIVGPDGKVFGIVDRTRLFVFDPQERAIVHLADVGPQLGRAVHQQGPRVFVQAPDGRIFVLFVSGIAQLDPETYEVTMLAEAPRGLSNGGAYLDGRLYFASGPNLYSWEVPPAE